MALKPSLFCLYLKKPTPIFLLMKIKILFTLATCALLSVAANAQQRQKAFVEKVVAKYEAMSSISFIADYNGIYYSGEETNFQSDYRLVRNKKDTLFGTYFWYDAQDPERGDYCEYYNNGQGYYIDHGQKTIYKYDMPEEGFGFTVGCLDNQFISNFFIKPDTIMKIINNRKNPATYSDTIINKSEYLVARMFYPDTSSMCCTDEMLMFYFNRKTENLEKVSHTLYSLGDTNYNEWTLNNITLNKETTATLEEEYEKIAKKYILTPYVPNTHSTSKAIENGTHAPVFSAKTYPDFKEVSLSDYKGKIVVLHFWYMARGWHTEQIPILNSIQQKYKDDVVVLGINPFDNDAERHEKMAGFIKEYAPVYPLMFINRNVLQPYNLFSAYNIYILDQNGIIRNPQWSGGKLEEDLDKVIQKLLKKIKPD